MIDYLRSLFGLKRASGKRKVVGGPNTIQLKDLPYIKDSTKRLVALQELYNRYKSTPHAHKIKTVYDETKRIHTYLVSRSRGYELELFHLQHTDHFLNTFSVIINVHQQHEAAPEASAGKGRRVLTNPFRRELKEVKAARMQNTETSRQAYADIKDTKNDVPRITVPELSINTFSRLVYLKEDTPDGVSTHVIGYTSDPEEKEAFVAFVSERLGLEEVSYIGNAMVFLPSHNKPKPAEIVPVIHWNGTPFVLSLEEDLIYPVRLFRKKQ